MMNRTFFFPIQDKCTVKNCKNKPLIGLTTLTGTHPTNLKYSTFACLCKEHKEYNEKNIGKEKGLIKFIEVDKK